jgi:hypothetical protein
MKTLRKGAVGDEVKLLQAILIQQGFGRQFNNPNEKALAADGRFGSITEMAVIYFQQTHQGPDGKMLDDDGIVGPNTWWALQNPSGNPQKSGLAGFIPEGIIGRRKSVLELALSEHAAGVHEEPDGSNYGDGVTKYGGQRGWAWCMLFAGWIVRQVFEYNPFGSVFALVRSAWAVAKKKGWVRAIPTPGDLYIILHKDAAGNLNGTGHTGLVLAVSEDGAYINTVSGNEGNRVKMAVRETKRITGFIDFYEEPPVEFKRGLTAMAEAGTTQTT